MKSSRRRAPEAFAETIAWMSPSTCSCFLTFSATRVTRSSLSTPARKSFIGGMLRPSPLNSRAFQLSFGAPMSATWAHLRTIAARRRHRLGQRAPGDAQPKVQLGVDLEPVTRRHHRRRLALLDDGRPLEAVAGPEGATVVDGRVHPAAGVAEVRRARPLARRPR